MPTFKNIPDSYNITTPLFTINGNLFVTGNSQQVVSTNSAISDHLIVLNHGLSLTSPPNPLGAAIEVDRGTSANVQLCWNETVQNWQVTTDGTTYANIATASAGGGLAITGNIDMGGYTLYTSNAQKVTIDSNLALKTTSTAPAAVSGYNVVYSKTPAGGGSGLYVTNTTSVAQELATQAAAIKYAIIFG